MNSSLQAQGAKSVDLVHHDAGLRRRSSQLVGKLLILCQVNCATFSPCAYIYLCSRRHLSMCCSLISTECKSFPRDAFPNFSQKRWHKSLQCLGQRHEHTRSPRKPDTARKSGPSGFSALRMDRLCPAGQKEAAGFARCLLSIQPTDHSISLGKFPFRRRNWDMKNRHETEFSVLTFGMLHANCRPHR